MRRMLMLWTLSVMAASVAFADGPNGMGAGGAMMGGSGMMMVADDNSVLVNNMDRSGMMGGGPGSQNFVGRELVNIDASGSERWRVSFTEGWPMMPCADGDLVVVVLVDDWFTGTGRFGDGGWNGGGMGGGGTGGSGGSGDHESVLMALDLETGVERWRATIDGDMMSKAQFSPDGSRIYLSVMDWGGGGGMGQGPMRQGDAPGAGFMNSSTVIAFDRNGNQLWTFDSGGE